MNAIALLIILILTLPRISTGMDIPERARSIYGFSKSLPPFKGKSSEECVEILKSWGSNVIYGGHEDPDFVKAAHQAGMKVFAEIGIFVGERNWERYPESRPITSSGSAILKDKWYAGVTPTIDAVRAERLKAIRDLMKNHDLDGVWLDFIRWPCHWEVHCPRIEQTSFDPITVSKFQSSTGIRIPPALSKPEEIADWILSNHADDWTSFKCDQITTFVEDARNVIKEFGEDKILGLFGVPWRDDYDGAITRIIGQDYEALSRFVDVFSPMLYHRMCDRSVAWIGEVTADLSGRTGRPIWPVIQAVNEPDSLSDAEFNTALKTAVEARGSTGVIVFSLGHALKEGRMSSIKKGFGEKE